MVLDGRQTKLTPVDPSSEQEEVFELNPNDIFFSVGTDRIFFLVFETFVLTLSIEEISSLGTGKNIEEFCSLGLGKKSGRISLGPNEIFISKSYN